MRGRLLVAITVLAMLAGACGDSGGDTTTTDASGGDGGTSVTAGAGGVTTTTAAGGGDETTTTTTVGDEGDGGGVAAGGDVGELLERFQQSRVRATYLLDEGDDENTLTLSQDPTADPPVSAILSDEDGFHIIFSGDAMTMCDANAGQCFAVPSEGTDPSLFAGAFLSPFLSSFLAFSSADTVGFDVDTEPVEVAGRSGLCFTVTPDAFVGADFDEVRQCVDDETGAMLLFEIKEAGGDFERVLELVEFGDPLPSDFEPPFPLVDVPTG